ncbi:MAG: Arginyl-tRNA synthetase, partial [Firmicutes bacterium]|nr:Arginyl-tRNA synthetase [Bacillota bacterium]
MNPIQKIKEELARMVIEALEKARDSGQLNYELIPEFVIEVPKDSGHGDFACNVAMLLARQARMAPRRIAEMITGYIIINEKFLEKVEVAGAGFINFFLNDNWLYEIPEMVVKMADHFGENPRVNKKVQVEFVSANPTGNLHMGNARGGALGDTLANVLARAGYDVEREFYINDCGNQIEVFGQSLEARYLQLMGQDVEFPENGYAGQDVVDTVKNIIREYKDCFLTVNSAERRQRMIAYA